MPNLRHNLAIVLAMHLAMLAASVLHGQEASPWTKRDLAPLPQALGFAGPYCGLVDNQLVVAGGANFPDGFQQGSTKVWHDQVFLLDTPGGKWREIPRIPRPLGYGVSITIPEGMILIGGSDSKQHFANVYLLEKKQASGQDAAFQFRELKPLPTKLANMSGVLIANQILVAGGSVEPGEQSASNKVFSLDLGTGKNRKLDGEWVEQTSLPGPGRLLPGIAAINDELFVFGGAAIEEVDGKPRRRYLKNGFRKKISNDVTSDSNWIPIADLPVPLVATPTPSPLVGPDHFLVCGGDDGSRVGFEPVSEHPGFNGTCWLYDAIADKWTKFGSLRSPTVTTNIVPWKDEKSSVVQLIVPSGELRPRVRTPAVISISINKPVQVPR